MHTVDPLVLHHVLVDTMKVKRPPVAITYCRDHIPAGYEPATVVACGIVREAESGRRVYIDANHHDCDPTERLDPSFTQAQGSKQRAVVRDP